MDITRRTLIGSGALAVLAACSESGGSTTPASTARSSIPSASPTVAGSATSATVGSATATPTATSTAIPKLSVETAASGLEYPWDLVFVDDAVVFTQRTGVLSVLRDGKVATITADLDDVQVSGEGGLLGLELSPDFASDRRVIACFNTTAGDIKVVPLALSDDLMSATRLSPLLTGIPENPSGQHSGCRPRIGSDGLLYIGTGDTASGTHPQDLDSLGGKVLRLGADGSVPAGNPWAAGPGSRRFVWSRGHRNVQGLAVQPGTGRMFSVEHGTSVDDEVNLLAKGANFGWNPVVNGSYNQDVPMTDTSIDGVRAAVWSSGDPTIATSGADFATGAEWGGYAGRLMVACLKGQRLLAMQVRGNGTIGDVHEVPELAGFGRLRTARLGPDGALWVTTSNGGDDKLLRVTPA